VAGKLLVVFLDDQFYRASRLQTEALLYPRRRITSSSDRLEMV